MHCIGPESDYELVSRLEDVHSAKVTALEFHPHSGNSSSSNSSSMVAASSGGGGAARLGVGSENLLLVTGSHDQTFKIWEGEETWEGGVASAGDEKDSKGKKKGGDKGGKHAHSITPLRRVARWWCRSKGGYRQRKVLDAAFSLDSEGSLLAVAVGAGVALIEPLSNKLRTVLVHPPPSEPVDRVMFLKESPFLVAASAHMVQVRTTKEKEKEH